MRTSIFILFFLTKVAFGNEFFVTQRCSEKEQNCFQVKTTKGKDVLVSKKKVKQLKLQSASLNEDGNLTIALDKASSKTIYKITSENVGKNVSLVLKDLELVSAQVMEPIKDTAISVHLTGSQEENLKLCKNLNPECELEESSKSKNNQTDVIGAMLERLNKAKEMASKYESLNTSPTWTFLETKANTKEHKGNIISILNSFKSPKDKKGKALYNLQGEIKKLPNGKFQNRIIEQFHQEFDIKKNKYIYSNGKIKVIGHGWINRSDVFPAIAFESDEFLEQSIFMNRYMKKCKEFLKKLPQFKGKNVNEIINSVTIPQYISSKEAYCIRHGKKVCQKKEKELVKFVNDSDCSNL